MTKETAKLIELIGQIVERFQDRDIIEPSVVATEAMHQLDPGHVTHPLIYIGCHLQLRQIARSFCRNYFRDPDGVDEKPIRSDRQFELFPALQWRYPKPHAPGEEPSYVLRDQMGWQEILFNVERLDREGDAKKDHARQLYAWGLSVHHRPPGPEHRRPARPH